MRALRTSQPASDELSQAVRWYEARRSGLGGEFFDAVADALQLIEARPEIGSAASADLLIYLWFGSPMSNAAQDIVPGRD